VQGKGEGGGEDAAILPRGYEESHAKAAKDAKGEIFDYFPKLWDADYSRPAVPGHAHAWILYF
jgi:hypothetical protein